MAIYVQTLNNKKLPDLRQMLQRGKVKRQSIQEQRAVLEAISESYGIPLRKKGEKVSKPKPKGKGRRRG